MLCVSVHSPSWVPPSWCCRSSPLAVHNGTISSACTHIHTHMHSRTCTALGHTVHHTPTQIPQLICACEGTNARTHALERTHPHAHVPHARMYTLPPHLTAHTQLHMHMHTQRHTARMRSPRMNIHHDSKTPHTQTTNELSPHLWPLHALNASHSTSGTLRWGDSGPQAAAHAQMPSKRGVCRPNFTVVQRP